MRRTEYLQRKRSRKKNLKRLAFTAAVIVLLLILAHLLHQDSSNEVINLISQPVYAEVPKATVIPTSIPTPAPKPDPKIEAPVEEKIAYIKEVFGESEGARGVTMLRSGENGTLGQNRTNKNRNGTVDYGIFQINSIHEKKYGPAFKTDWKANVRVAKSIHDDWKGFGAWTQGYQVGDVTYLQKMQKGR